MRSEALQSDIDDGFGNVIYHLRDLFPKSTDLDKEFLHSRQWELLHHAGYHTLAHKDADGLGTYVRILSGVKMWTLIRPDGAFDAKNRGLLEKATMPMIDFVDSETGRNEKEWLNTEAQVALVQAEPGDLL